MKLVTITNVLQPTKGNLNLAINQFKSDLDKLRKIANVETICMHGSPMSKYDSKDMWKEFNYKDYGIIGEPYFDVNFNEVMYLTDTGRTWKNQKISVRDHVDSRFSFDISSSNDLIQKLKKKYCLIKLCSTFIPRDGRITPYFGVRNWFSKTLKIKLKR